MGPRSHPTGCVMSMCELAFWPCSTSIDVKKKSYIYDMNAMPCKNGSPRNGIYVVNTAYRNTGALILPHSTLSKCSLEDAGLHYQLRISKDCLCRLYALWKKSVHTLDIAMTDDEWGPSADELLNANIAEVMAGWGDNPMEDDDNDGDGADQNLDEEDNMDIGLINALEAVDLADAYRGSRVDEVDDFCEFNNDI